MNRSCVVGVDVGSTYIKAVLVEVGGAEVATVRRPTPWRGVGPGRTEVAADVLLDTVATVLAELGGHPCTVAGIGVSGMAEAGALLAASLTAPLPLRWPLALAVWAIPAVVAFVVWLFVSGSPSSAPSSAPVSAPWRSRRAWYATFFMGGQSLLYYASLAWLAARYTALGSSAAEAGLLLGLFSATQLVSSPIVGVRGRVLYPL